MKNLYFKTIKAFCISFCLLLFNIQSSKAGLVGSNYPKFKVGPRIGINFCELSNYDKYVSLVFSSGLGPNYSYSFQNNQITGFNIGLTAELEASKYFSTVVELTYFQCGNQVSGRIDSSVYYINTQLLTKINYLQIPILGKIKLGNEKFTFNIFGGPAINIALNGQEKFVLGRSVQEYPLPVEMTGGIKQFDFSFIGGIGITMKFDKLEWSYDLRYNKGLLDTNYDTSFGYPSITNSVISLSTCIAFEL